MRSPRDVISHVSETCVVGDEEIERFLEVGIKPNSLARTGGAVYFDLAHIPKGALIEVNIDPSSPAKKVNHDDHLSVSAYLIGYRFLTVWSSAVVSADDLLEFTASMDEAQAALILLPYQKTDTAILTFNQYFDSDSKALRAVLAIPGVVIDVVKMQALFSLCKRLVRRYLLLVETKVKKGEVAELRFNYIQQLTEYQIARDGKEIERPKRRHFNYASPPSSFRIHTPWAKRTDHYIFKMDPVDGYFIARQFILLKGPRGLVRLKKSSPKVKWSINPNQGRRTHLFINGAASMREPIYIGIQNLEIPGRSTSRAFSLSWLVFLAVLSFELMALYLTGPLGESASLILALAAIGAFASAPTAGVGVLGFPLLSRFVPRALGFALAFMILWVTSRTQTAQPVVHELFTPEFMAILRVSWDSWVYFGGIPVVVFTLALACRVSLRRRALIKNYARAWETAPIISKNFY